MYSEMFCTSLWNSKRYLGKAQADKLDIDLNVVETGMKKQDKKYSRVADIFL